MLRSLDGEGFVSIRGGEERVVFTWLDDTLHFWHVRNNEDVLTRTRGTVNEAPRCFLITESSAWQDGVPCDKAVLVGTTWPFAIFVTPLAVALLVLNETIFERRSEDDDVPEFEFAADEQEEEGTAIPITITISPAYPMRPCSGGGSLTAAVIST